MPHLHLFLLGIAAAVLLWSGIRPHGYFIWALEVAPAVIGFLVLAATYRRFPLTNLVYVLITIHAIILMIGGHYTYAEVPLFNWLRDIGVFGRNNYDKVGHFAQGFFPAIVTREVLVRTSSLRGSRWLGFLVVCVCTAFSAFYEVIEWWVGVLSGSAGDAFLGTQGYVWDTQSDMFLCMVGATLSLLLFSRIHDRALASLSERLGAK